MQRSFFLRAGFSATALLRQGWGESTRGGGWGDDGEGSGSWGSGGTGAGWSSGGAAGNDAGGWSGGGAGGWGNGGTGNSGGWGGGGRGGWGGNDGGWSGAAQTGGSSPRGRGLRGRGRGRGNAIPEWGSAHSAGDDQWGAAPPSFNPPVRRIDPLTLTAVEVEIDGIRKLVGQRIIVTGVSDDTTWHVLKDHLRQCGEVTYCRIFSGGRATIEFATPEEAAKCITELQGSELEGATLFMREDREDTVLINTRRKIREAREARQRAEKEVKLAAEIPTQDKTP